MLSQRTVHTTELNSENHMQEMVRMKDQHKVEIARMMARVTEVLALAEGASKKHTEICLEKERQKAKMFLMSDAVRMPKLLHALSI